MRQQSRAARARFPVVDSVRNTVGTDSANALQEEAVLRTEAEIRDAHSKNYLQLKRDALDNENVWTTLEKSEARRR